MFSISGKAGFGLKMLCASVALVMVAKVATVAAEDTFPACDGDNLNKLAWEDEIPGQGEKWVIDTQGDIRKSQRMGFDGNGTVLPTHFNRSFSIPWYCRVRRSWSRCLWMELHGCQQRRLRQPWMAWLCLEGQQMWTVVSKNAVLESSPHTLSLTILFFVLVHRTHHRVNIEYQGRQAQAIMADSCPGVSCNDLCESPPRADQARVSSY